MNNSYITAEDAGAAFRKYAEEITRYPLITAEEEIALTARMRAGDGEARAQMIRANLRLVVKLALGYTNLGLPLLDLIEEGNIGLMKAIDRFDPAKGAKLGTYAIWWIKQRIKRALQNQGKIIRLPVHFGDKVFRVNRIAARMSETLGRVPTHEELSDELGLDTAEVATLRAASIRPVSLNAPVGDSDDLEFGETIGDDRHQSPFEMLRQKDLQRQLRGVFHVLSERELRIVRGRFGLDGGKPKTLEQVGAELGVTRERVRQLQNLAFQKLRGALNNRQTATRALSAAA